MFKSRHPGPRCVWKGGSEPRLFPRLPAMPAACSKKHVLEQRPITFGYLAGPRTAQKRVWEQLPITFCYKCLFGNSTPSLFAIVRVLMLPGLDIYVFFSKVTCMMFERKHLYIFNIEQLIFSIITALSCRNHHPYFLKIAPLIF